MSTLFIADLHLSENFPVITAGFLQFIEKEALYADALYILGDLFEVWIGDDEHSELHQIIANALLKLKQRDIPCYFIHGNRDFLIGKKFATISGMTLLPESKVVNIYQKNALIMHGDILCTDDHQYQRFRRSMYNPLLRNIFSLMPLFIRRKIANRLRDRSQQQNNQKSLDVMDVMDVNHNAVEHTLSQAGCNLLIHGHTHRPVVHQWHYNNIEMTRIVLGDWWKKGSVLRFFPDGNYELAFFDLS